MCLTALTNRVEFLFEKILTPKTFHMTQLFAKGFKVFILIHYIVVCHKVLFQLPNMTGCVYKGVSGLCVVVLLRYCDLNFSCTH